MQTMVVSLPILFCVVFSTCLKLCYTHERMTRTDRIKANSLKNAKYYWVDEEKATKCVKYIPKFFYLFCCLCTVSNCISNTQISSLGTFGIKANSWWLSFVFEHFIFITFSRIPIKVWCFHTKSNKKRVEKN